MTKAILHSLFGLALAGAIGVAAACSGGAGSSLSACPSPTDVAPGGFCTDGQSCASAAIPGDCPGAAGALICNCTASGWVCADPSGSECFPDAGEAGTDEGGTDEGGTEEGGGEEDGSSDGSSDT
jgi:hypothetical protein